MRTLRRVSLATAALAIAYLSWIFVSRAVSARRWASLHKPPVPENAGFARAYGGTGVRILQFYAREASVMEGGRSVICYGVVNARAVRIDPAISGVGPSINRCVEVPGEKATRYTLTAEGFDGRSVSESFTLGVRPDEETLPRISRFAVAKHERDYTGKWIFSLQYAVQNPEEVSIDPPVFRPLHRSPMGSFYVAPDKTTTYTLTVTGKYGHKTTKSLTIEVPPRP